LCPFLLRMEMTAPIIWLLSGNASPIVKSACQQR
jgi:hypothetical protein